MVKSVFESNLCSAHREQAKCDMVMLRCEYHMMSTSSDVYCLYNTRERERQRETSIDTQNHYPLLLYIDIEA